MLKILRWLCLVFVFMTVPCLATDGYILDTRLKLLLNDEDEPFYSDAIRQQFLEVGMRQSASVCKFAATGRCTSYVLTASNNTSIAAYGPPAIGDINHVLGIKLLHDDYGLREMKHRDIGHKKIASITPLRYWYTGVGGATGLNSVGVYPPASDSNLSVDIYVAGVPDWEDTTSLHPGFENETILYALYLCKLRRGETQAAAFIKQIALSEMLDMKAILENRPMDITLKKEVVPR